MCAFRKSSREALRNAFRVTRGRRGGNARQNRPWRAEKSAATASIAGVVTAFDPRKSVYYWAFRAGTAFADLFAMKVNAAMRLLSEI
jgi:hypothetical protein